jgi:hypothetical protein
MSRFIGIGTFDVDKPVFGKQLSLNTPLKWMQCVHKYSGYENLEEYGYDFNIYKHANHGIEWRIFDAFDKSLLEDVCLLILLMCDFAMNKTMEETIKLEKASASDFWNDLCFRGIFLEGSDGVVDLETLSNILGLKQAKLNPGQEHTFFDVLTFLSSYLYENHRGKMWYFFNENPGKEPKIPNFNSFIRSIFSK